MTMMSNWIVLSTTQRPISNVSYKASACWFCVEVSRYVYDNDTVRLRRRYSSFPSCDWSRR